MELFTYADQNVETLSGGQRRRVAIAMMLVRNADLYVLDEAFQGLDDEIKEKVMQTVKESLTGKTAIFVTHSESERAFFGGRKSRIAIDRKHITLYDACIRYKYKLCGGENND